MSGLEDRGFCKFEMNSAQCNYKTLKEEKIKKDHQSYAGNWLDNQ